MALVSPGVEVTIVDQSQYLPAAPSSVPFILMATAQNKANAAGTGVATGTLAANANKLYRVTSQRELVTLFGNPFFYKTTNGTPLQGYELNEYGLFAAYSSLGASNLCYVLRADIDLAQLVGRTGRPSGAPADGTYWLNTVSSRWGIFEFNQTTGQFVQKTPLVIADNDLLEDTVTGQPLSSVGNIGDYAIVFVVDVNGFTAAGDLPSSYSTYWYKDVSNNWVVVGSADWRNNWPTVQGSNTPTSLTAANTFTINGVTITVPAAPNNTVAGVATAINNANIPFVSAASVNGKLELYMANDSTVVIAAGTGTVLTNLGITAGTYYSPAVFFGTNAQQPLWRLTDSESRPTGSVWVKSNSANGGTQINMSQYSAATELFASRNCPTAENDWTATNALDSTGGKNIVEGALYTQYPADPDYTGPVQIFRRFNTGPAVFVGSVANPSITTNTDFKVNVSLPNSNSLSSDYTVSLSGYATPLNAQDFVTAWTASNIPYTTADISVTGAVIITHTEGGVIVLSDDLTTNLTVGSPSPLAQVGFVPQVTPGAKWGAYKSVSFTAQTVTGGAGSGATFNVITEGYEPTFTINNGGTGYSVNDVLTMSGGGSSSVYRLKVTTVATGSITGVQWLSGYADPVYSVQLSNWRAFVYIPNEIAPTLNPDNETNWFYSVANQVDIMTNVGGEWKGYRNVSYATNGLPQATGTPLTDPNGPIISASAPTTQSDGTALVYGDLWINTSDLENYPVINRWQEVDGQDQWVLINNTDQTSENGIVFADARWAPNGTTDPIDDPIPTIVSMLTSDYVDLDAPAATAYPQGVLLFNTRRSGYNVKQFRLNYFNSASFPDAVLPAETNTWVSVSGLQSNGAPYMGRKAQRNMVVQALRSSINTNTEIREEETFFNLIACPNYPELQPDMIVLNNDRAQTAYIIGDTPMRLADNAADIVSWATNQAGAASTGESGLVTRNTYMGIYYPSGIAPDLTGTQVVVPASHMMIRTMIFNDTVAYPWFAPAGQRRGTIDNADNLGYIDAATGEFVPTKNRIELRNVQYSNFINPMAFFTNVGLLNYGNKNSFDSQSALDRTNVARLVAYLRYQLQNALRPFIFEPNDTITRAEATGVVQTLLADIMTKRGIYDYLVVCDESNNTPERIDRNELWVDIAIEPIKAVEFIYIPVRILNTGEISGVGLANVA